MEKQIILIQDRIPRNLLRWIAPVLVRIASLGRHRQKMQCPVCGHHHPMFLLASYHFPRKNSMCPSCLSLERHRLVALYLSEKTDFYTHCRTLLHIAPEACFIPRFRKLFGEGYVTGDLLSPLAEVKMNICHIPFPDAHFDVVICNHVLEHIEDDLCAMRELHRVLRPGGWGILQVPMFPIAHTYEDPAATTPEARTRLYGQHDHVRMYGADYPERLRAAGFVVTEDDFVRTLSKEQIAYYGLDASETIYKVERPV